MDTDIHFVLFFIPGAVQSESMMVEKEELTVSPANTSGNMKMVSPFKRPTTPLESLDVFSPPSPVASLFKENSVEPVSPAKASSTPLKEVNRFDVTPPCIDGPFTPTKDHGLTPATTKLDDLPDVPPTPTESNVSEQEKDSSMLSEGGMGNRRHDLSKPPAMRYRIMCQCGAQNCRKWLY